MSQNYWDLLMGDDEHAASYMETYGEGVGSQTRFTLASLINDGESVLDLGCGPAWNFDHFMAYGPKIRYQGYDYSERFVRVANQRINQTYPTSALGIVNTDTDGYVKLGDCRSLPEEDGSWDVVILQDCLEHTNGYEKPVAEALRVARKRVIVTFWHLTENDDHINSDGNDGYGAWYSKPKWEEYLNSLGYKWTHSETPEGANRHHDYYTIEKELK